MVQRKSPKSSKSDPKAMSPHHQSKIQEGGDLTRKTKKPSTGSPNYMKPTTSSHARKERLQVPIQSPNTIVKMKSPKNWDNSLSKPQPLSISVSGTKPERSLTRNSSLKPVRSSMKKSSGVNGLYPKKNASRPTCSSTLKDSKFPEALDLNPEGVEPEGASIMKVCPYTYCSLNGHVHKALPPLKNFLSARRRLVKNQRSMKLKRWSSLIAINRIPFEDAGFDIFVDFYDTRGKYEAENQIDQSILDINYEEDLDLSRGLSDEELDMLMNWEEKVDYSESLDDGFDPKLFNPLLEIAELGNSSSTNEIIGLGDENPEIEILDDVEEFDCMEIEMEIFNDQLDERSLDGNQKKRGYNRVRGKGTEGVEERIRDFNPRPPRFLPVEDDPESEKVRLRHQMADERKNAEEWMIDYALQQVVTKLAPARKRKVELLVQAFESIMPLPVFETPLQGIPNFTHARPIQACS